MKYLQFLFVIILGVQRASMNMSTLSSASTRPTVSAMPTTLPSGVKRRDNHEEQGDIYDGQPLNLFKLNDENLRRSQAQIWDWDHWCQLQPKMGNCSMSVLRYYYDTQLDQCSTFSYGGCNGNKNNFETQLKCERHCKGAAYMAARASDATKFCTLQPSSGLCIGLMTKYYYDLNEGACKKFSYGGCGGNNNRFDSAGECMATCRGSKYLRSGPEGVY